MPYIDCPDLSVIEYQRRRQAYADAVRRSSPPPRPNPRRTNHLRTRVIAPDGTGYASYTEAAKALGIARSTFWLRVRSGVIGGWKRLK